MTHAAHDGAGSRLAAALRLCLEFRASGRTDVAAFLAQHADFGDLLPGLLGDPDTRAPEAVDPSAPEPAPPATFGDYRIECEVGRGGMGIVYAAVQGSLGRRVALKVLSAPLLHAERALWRFQRESRLLARFECKNIVRVIDAGAVAGVPFYAMEFIDGAPLSAVLDAVRRHGLQTATGATVAAAVAGAAHGEAGDPADASANAGPAPPRSYLDAVVEIAAQVADALALAHAASVIHRDVKPGNVLVRRDGTAVLSDFGIARQQSAAALTATGDFAGTPYYVAPEQARGADVDHRADVFSLGVMLYELLTLERPFDGKDTLAVLARIQRDDPRDPRAVNPRVSADLSAVVLKALAKEPAHRYAGAGELAADLRACLAGAPVTARPPGRLQRVWRWSRREPWKAAALATVLLSVSALGLVSVLFTQRLLDETRSTKAALDVAEANFATAMEAVEAMLTRVGQIDLESVPQMEPVRRELLQRALKFHEGLVAARPGHRGAQRQLVRAQASVARIHRLLSDNPAAIVAAEAAITGMDALLATAPADQSLALDRVEAQLTQASARQMLGEDPGAETQASDAVARLERLTGVPDEIRRRRSLATAFDILARCARYRGDAARDCLTRTIAEFAWLRREEPEDPAISARLAENRRLLADLEINAGRTEAAEDLLRQALADLEHARPTLGVQQLRCGLRSVRAQLYRATGRLREAEAEQVAVVSEWQALVRAFPNTPWHRVLLADAWTKLGRIRRHLNMTEEAISATEQAVATADELAASHPDVVEYRAILARALLYLGTMQARAGGPLRDGARTLARALEQAERLHAEDAGHGGHARLLAEVLAETGYVASVRRDHEQARRFYERALEVLGPAVARNPDELNGQDVQANLLRGVAETMLATGDAAGALAATGRSLAILRAGLQKAPQDPGRRRFARSCLRVRVRAAARAGDHGAAVASLSELDTLCDRATDACDNAALAAACMGGVEPATQRDAYGAAAVSSLRLAIERGYRDGEALAQDKRFAPLRDHPGFAEVQRALAR